MQEAEKLDNEASVRETIDNNNNYLMDDAGHMVANNDNDVVYNYQPYFEEPIKYIPNFGLDD